MQRIFLSQDNKDGESVYGKVSISRSQLNTILLLLGRHGSASLCRVERENKMAATYNVLAFKR